MPKQHGSRLKDIGSGNGFLLKEEVFTYEGRRSYLHPEIDLVYFSKLQPPESFMTKKQVRRLRHIHEPKMMVLANARIQSIDWVAEGARVNGLGGVGGGDSSQNRSSSSSSRPENYLDAWLESPFVHSSHQGDHSTSVTSASISNSNNDKNHAHPRRSKTGGTAVGGGGGGGRKASRISFNGGEGEDVEDLVIEDWEPMLQAGARFFRHRKTGECREHLMLSMPRRRQTKAMQSSATGVAAPAPAAGSGGGGLSTTLVPAGNSGSSAAANTDSIDRIGGREAGKNQEKEEEVCFGVGALVYDPKECHDLFDFLDHKIGVRQNE